MTMDPYQVLGVEKTSSEADIKAAYKKLAIQYHPDKNPGDKEAEEKFKEINAAYDILKDPNKKAEYDAYGSMGGTSSHGQGRRQYTGNHPFEHYFTDVGGFEEFFRNIHGGDFHHRRQSMRNPDLFSNINIPLETAFKGTTIPFEVTLPDGGSKMLSITVPPGVDNGLRLRLAEKGSVQNTNLPPGDLYVTISVEEHPTFKRLGSDLFVSKQVSIIEAALGRDLEIPTIDGSTVKVTIPPGTQPNQKLRLRGKGMTKLNNAKVRGDLYVVVNVTVPVNLTERQKEILRDFQKEMTNEASK